MTPQEMFIKMATDRMDAVEDFREDLEDRAIVYAYKELNATAELCDEALGKVARLQVDLHQTVVKMERMKEALEEIAGYSCDCQECAQQMSKLAKEALTE